MYSNFITPPDFVDQKLPNITVINATTDEVELLARMCEHSDEFYNIYLYRTEMNNDTWLQQAVDLSDAVILNTNSGQYRDLCLLDKTFYYGSDRFLENPKKIESPLHYFALTKETE